MAKFDEITKRLSGEDKKPKSKLESGVRGLAQGATMGFADEGAGVVGAAKDVLMGETPLREAGQAYRKNRDESREEYKAAEEENPLSYGAGSAAGSIGSLAIPGMGLAKGIKGAAALGALSSLGSSEADITEGNVSGALGDVASGAASSAAMRGLAPAMRGIRGRFPEPTMKEQTAKTALDIAGTFPKAATGFEQQVLSREVDFTKRAAQQKAARWEALKKRMSK